ncbi:MAG TPA: PHP domain-containing protein, partial [Terriglobales bacterium]|nr:PHP domain-containing protein [Terriglobales bacterium]
MRHAGGSGRARRPARERGTDFVPLRVRSHGSLLRGTASPAALVARALEHECPALALTDRDNLYLAIAFYRTARAEGLVPLLGAEVTPCVRSDIAGFVTRGAHEPDPTRVAEPEDDVAALRAPAPDTQGGALLLALDRRGWTHLCELLTLRHLDPAFDLTAALAPRHAGLHVIVESPGLAAGLLGAGVPAAAGEDAPRRAARAGGLWMGVR